MLKRLLLTTAVLSVTALPMSVAPALAQSSDQSAQPSATSSTPAPTGQSSDATPATPPPSDAIIAAEGNNEIRADKLIGMKVYNADGHEVGKVKDVVFDKDGKAKGVVLSVGGVLGIGAKSVGLQWKEIDLQPEQETVKVNYTKEQLEAAPTFQTHEAQASDQNSANQAGQPAPGPSPSGAAPAPSSSGSTQ